jgi:hypothetical protein
MTAARFCPVCRADLPADAPNGLCPQCLLRRGLQDSDPPAREGEGLTEAHPASPGTPTPAELAHLFPEMEVVELLGRGGMGAVYKARQPSLDRWVALKILPPETADDPAFAERFTREAHALARLSHPNIVTAYDFGRRGGLYYFLMEFVDGVNLRQLLDAKQITPPWALRLIPQICDALQYAHEEGVVHRDVKPENILLDKRGRVKIADFGLAKLLAGPPPIDESTGAAPDAFQPGGPAVRLTGTHQIMGTPHYMAPEQMASPQGVDHRADIYSLGVVFYELLTGRLPAADFAPPSRDAAVDVRLDAIVRKTLAREPGLRYQHAREVKDEVQSVAQASGGIDEAVLRSQGRLWLTNILAFAVVLGWLLCIYAWLGRLGELLDFRREHVAHSLLRLAVETFLFMWLFGLNVRLWLNPPADRRGHWKTAGEARPPGPWWGRILYGMSQVLFSLAGLTALIAFFSWMFGGFEHVVVGLILMALFFRPFPGQPRTGKRERTLDDDWLILLCNAAIYLVLLGATWLLLWLPIGFRQEGDVLRCLIFPWILMSWFGLRFRAGPAALPSAEGGGLPSPVSGAERVVLPPAVAVLVNVGVVLVAVGWPLVVPLSSGLDVGKKIALAALLLVALLVAVPLVAGGLHSQGFYFRLPPDPDPASWTGRLIGRWRRLFGRWG